MNYSSLKECIEDLERNGQLVRISKEVDPDLEMAAIHRRVFQSQGPALYFENVKGCSFPAVSNLFGTIERSRFIFRKTLGTVKKAFDLKADPSRFFKNPFQYFDLPSVGWHSLAQKVTDGPVLECETTMDKLPQIKCWPKDGGPFVLLPQVYTENQEKPGIRHSNLGMYRIQMAGNDYEPNREIGLHYQIRRDIGIHHSKALERGEPLRVSIFVGGPPAHTFAAVMYLPEDLPEVAFAGALGGRRFRYAVRDGFVISVDTDFCITGYVHPGETKTEGPFGDHLGYYSLEHPFPVLKVEKVYHRRDAVWPFTVVGRPPQEDTSFGKLIQEIASPVISTEIPGIKAVHAVDVAGVHPLLLAIGSERYLPYEKRKPQELLTLSNALLGYGPCSLAKYLLIVSAEDNPTLDIHDIQNYLIHFLERVDWRKDLHFQTQTTIDTLDYTGGALNEGSKVVMAAAGDKRRELATEVPPGLPFPSGFEKPRLVMPGVLVVQGPTYQDVKNAQDEIGELAQEVEKNIGENMPLIICVDDSDFCAEDLSNILWVTFTRSNPASDISGVRSFTEFKHWGCEGSLIIDARIKPHHAPVLEEDGEMVKKVEELGAAGQPLQGVF